MGAGGRIIVSVKHRRKRYFLEMRVWASSLDEANREFSLKLKEGKCRVCRRRPYSGSAPVLMDKNEVDDQFWPFYNIYTEDKKNWALCENKTTTRELISRFLLGDFKKDIIKSLRELFRAEYSLCEECFEEKNNREGEEWI